MGCVCIYALWKMHCGVQHSPKESGIKTRRPPWQLYSVEGLLGLWSRAWSYVPCALVPIYSGCTQHKSQSITLPSALLLKLSASARGGGRGAGGNKANEGNFWFHFLLPHTQEGPERRALKLRVLGASHSQLCRLRHNIKLTCCSALRV